MSSPAEVEFAAFFYSRRCFAERDVALLEQAYRLRYQVYVEECKYLSKQDVPVGRESDKFDQVSEHFCAFNLRDELVGYSRLVRADMSSRFPLEEHCDIDLAHSSRPPIDEAVEISRMVVRSDYRRRRGDTIVGVTIGMEGPAGVVPERRANSPQILLSLYKAMYLYCRSNGLKYWYAALEPNVARALGRIGAFTFKQIGPESDYYGMVAPYLAELDEMEDSVKRRNPALCAWLHRAYPEIE